MAGSEFFTVGLTDKVTGPSAKMGRAALKLEQQLSKLERARQVKLRADLGAQRLSLSADRIKRARAGFADKATPARGFKLAATEGAAGLKDIAFTLGGIAIAATAASVAIGVKLVGSIKEATDTALGSKLAFTALLGSAEKAEGFQNRALVLANRYGMDLTDTFAGVKNSLSAGFDRKQSESVLGLAADLRFLGATGEGVKRAMLAINQIKTAGVLQGDEIRQLSEVGGLDVEKVYARIGERMKITAKAGQSVNQQVIKLKEAGKIDALTAINSIADVIKGKTGMALGEAGALAANNTLDGLGGKLIAKAQTLLFEVGRESGPALVRGIQAIVGADTGETDVKIFLGLSQMMTDVGAFLERVGPKIPSIAENFAKAFSAASGLGETNLNAFADRLPEIATNLGNIAGSIVTIATYVAKVAGSGSVGGAIGTAVGSPGLGKVLDMTPWEAVKYAFRGDGKGSGAARGLDKGFGTGVALSQGAADGIAASGAAEAAAAGMGEGMKTAVDKKLKINSPSKVGFEQGKYFDQGLGDGQQYNDFAIDAAKRNATGVAQASNRALYRAPESYAADATAAADAIASGRSSGSIQVGDIHITIDGKGSTAKETAQETLSLLEDQFGNMIDRLVQGMGA